jgi:glycosyltransferase involved in cell wall biosynthesis
MVMHNPLVSAVIPTRNRPSLVLRAVHSSLDQTFKDLEVIVVIDGSDPATSAALAQINDERLRVIALSQSLGGSDARNAGVEAARGDWIAFLDDDDEWLPEKTEKQIAKARNSAALFPIVTSQLFLRDATGDKVWPRNPPTDPISEYLLARRSWSYGEGLISTITLLARRDLLLQVPFTSGLRRHQDWDWLLRCSQLPDVKIEYVAEPLAIWHLQATGKSVSRTNAWKISLGWLRNNRDLVTGRAYAGFIATQVAPQAASEGAWKSFFPLAMEMFVSGKPRPIDLVLYLGMWMLPHRLRRFSRRFA